MHQNCNNTPLIWASRYGHIKMVARLLEAKAQLEVQEEPPPPRAPSERQSARTRLLPA